VSLYYLTARAVLRQLQLTPTCAKHAAKWRCYHHIEMKPESIGRVLGIGLRVAGRVAGQRINAAAQASSNATSTPNAIRQPASAAFRSGNLARGVGGFLKPFRRVGGTVWLEVTGVFFLLPVLVFTPTLWRTRASWMHGPDHRTFVASAVVVAIFLYLGVTSFWRARKS
jgi:hypothetical protein